MTALAVETTHSSSQTTAPRVLMDAIEARMRSLVREGSESCQSAQPLAQQAAAYHLDSGGQRIRARLALHAGLALNLSTGDAVSIATAAELVHNASLVHDDLQDRDLTRHGVRTVWSAYGDGVAICAGDLLLSAAYCSLVGLSRPHLLPIVLPLLHRRISAASTGQCADLSNDAKDHVTVAEYENMAALKSGSLIALPLELALAASGEIQSMAKACSAAESFAIGYQIVDDLNDTQKDLMRKSARPAINAVAVMQRLYPNSDAYVSAGQLAKEHLHRSVHASLSLPRHSGWLLHQLAVDLVSRIDVGVS